VATVIESLPDFAFGMGLTAGVGSLFTAAVLGVTHGIEPDHVAGITALTHEVRDPTVSALVGGCFATGHALLVVAWVVAADALFGTTAFPPAFAQFGTLFVGILLALLSLYLGLTGTRKLVHRHRHEHEHERKHEHEREGAGDGEPHSHYHLHLPASIRPTTDGHEAHAHRHTVFEYLKIGTLGALFTLSPPVSMIAFLSVTVPEGGAPVLTAIVAVYTVAIVATMTVVGGGAGSLFKFSKARGERLHAISQVAASVIVLGFAVNIFVGLFTTLSI
jgi:ABC-type nickel/cobalt efflux system permease component RcnA